MKSNLQLLYGVLLLWILSQSAIAQKSDYVSPKLTDPASWSLVLLPDPQTYVKFERNQAIFDLMTSWVSENIDPLQIKMVLCTGDLVEQNELLAPDGVNGNQTSKAQWQAVSRAFGRLDGKVPYVAATGNHDYGFKSAENRNSRYNEYFPVDKNILSQKLLREVGTDFLGQPTLANAVYDFTSPHGKNYLIMVLEFAPRNDVITWAKKVIEQPKYKDHQVIVLTHSYMDSDNQHIVKEEYPLTDVNYGAAMFSRLVRPSTNIRMVFAGHIGSPDSPKEHVAFRTDLNSAGKPVQQMVFNAQAMGGGWHGNGGDGWLRILEFLPDGKTVKVKTFSPLFAISPTTRQYAWRTEPFDQFTFTLD
ncbi:hypothetical protein DYBT9275_01533 [Dyadobacter sp. CECT 9275]|uniref:Calcineurin-like phosphoesterase domain-containing protein n=1 Tax=Dyadobacter helix TaxID=2822344 RepID=A0A916JC98_9BACT|nr:metallophosphoesterase [Dyadobacter sp. CECT 9275]CAG4995045.1 hypothetical protein DYBT9275_01533 [Dyadobacter sp. CECT 9275]